MPQTQAPAVEPVNDNSTPQEFILISGKRKSRKLYSLDCRMRFSDKGIVGVDISIPIPGGHKLEGKIKQIGNSPNGLLTRKSVVIQLEEPLKQRAISAIRRVEGASLVEVTDETKYRSFVN